METIYDYNPTRTELRMMFGERISREEYSSIQFDQVMHTAHLYYLFVLREETMKANSYLRIMKDAQPKK